MDRSSPAGPVGATDVVVAGRVLVVEDNEVNRLLAETQLRALGYESRLTSGAAEALAAEAALLQEPSQQTLLLGGPYLSVLIAKEPTNTFATLTVTNCVYGHQHLVLSKTNLSDSYWN